MNEEYVKISKAAKILGFHINTIYRMIHRGDLECVKIGRSIRIPVAALEAKKQSA